MSKKKQKRLARQIAMQVLRELSKLPAPIPTSAPAIPAPVAPDSDKPHLRVLELQRELCRDAASLGWGSAPALLLTRFPAARTAQLLIDAEKGRVQ
jgi:hypothetical protein